MSSDQANLIEKGIEALKKVFSSSNSSTDENTANQNNTTNNTGSNRKMAKDSEAKDEHKLAEPRYNGQLIAGMRVAELKSALDKLGVGSKRTDKKADLEIALKAAIEDHHHLLSPGGKRSKSIPTPLSGSKSGGAVRSLSSPPGTGRNLRSAGYGLRSRDNSSGRGTTSRSKAAETSAGHIKASVATSNKGSYEENDMLYYSVKSGASKAMALSRSPSVASKRSRTRSVRSARSSRANTHVSEGEEDSSVGSSEEEEENAPPTVVKKRVPAPAPLKPREPTPKKREPTPSKKEPTPKKREPTPQKKTTTPNKKQRVEASKARAEEEESQLESASADSDSEGDAEAQHAALNDSNNFFDAADGAGDDDAAEMYDDEGLESPEQQQQDEGEGEDSEGAEGSDADAESQANSDVEMVEEPVGDGEGQLLEPEDEEYSDNSEDEEEGEEGDGDGEGDEQFEDQYEDGEYSGEGEGEGSQEEGDGDGDEDEEDSDSEGEEYNFGDYIKPTKGKVQQGEVIDLMDSDDDDAESEEEYVPPAFPSFTFTATPAVAKAAAPAPFTFGTAPKPEAAAEFSFTAPKVVPGTTFTASAAAPLPVYNFSIGSSGTKAAPAKVLPTVGFNGLPYTAPALVAAPAAPLNFAAYSFDKAPAPTFAFPPPVQVVSAAAPTPVAPVAQPSADLSPAAVAFSKLSTNFVSVFASNLTSSSDKKEKLTAEEYSLLKTLLERSKPAELADDEAKSKMDVVPSAQAVKSPSAAGSTNESAKKVTIAPLDTQHSSDEKKAQPVEEAHRQQENKENKTAKSISFDPRSTAIPRTSFDGAGWNSRESFLPSPPETPGSVQLPQVGDSSVSGQLFAENASVRLAHRMPTPYHAAKRTAFHAGWTGGSEVTMGAEEEDFLTMPPSKRQSLGGYRSIQYRQATPGAAYVNANRLSVGSGMLSDTPDSTWSAGSNLRTSSARSSISGYPSALPQPAYGSHMGGASYTPMFRNNAARFTPLTGPQYPASAVAANAVQAPAMSSETRVSRLPVAARTSNGSITNSASKALPATLSYIQRRKLQMQSDSGASAAVARKILDTLGGLSTPMEEQRQKPTAITWHSDTDKVTQVVAAAPAVASTRDASKPAQSVSFAAGSSPKPSSFPGMFVAEKEAPKSLAEATGVQLKSPFLHSSVRKQLDDGKEADKVPPSFGFAIPPKVPAVTSTSSSAASTSAEEFPFTAPTEVSGMEEYVGTITGGASSVKYIFSPPNTRKTEPAVAATSSVTTAKPAAAAAKASATVDSAAASSGTNIWAASMINDGVKCSVCLAKNKKDATKCAACENPIGASAVAPKAAPAAPAAASTGTNNIWAASSINDGVKCKTCLSKNKAGATKCAACECPIGDAAPASASSSSAATASKAPGAICAGGFTFGTPAAASAAPAATEASKGFTFGSTAPAASAPAVPAKATEGFTFGGAPAAAASATTAGSGFTFGATSDTKTPAAAAEKPAATNSGFSFPVAASDSKPTETKPAAFGGFTFGAPAALAPVVPAVAKAESTPVSSVPSFGSFGKPKDAETSVPASTPAPTTAPFTFGGAPATAATPAAFGGFGAKRSADSDVTKDKEDSDEQPSRKRKEEPAAGAFGASSLPTFGAFPALPTVDASKPATTAAFTGFGGFAGSTKPAGDTPSASAVPAFGGFNPQPAEEKKIEAPAAAPADAKSFTFGATAAPAATPAFVPSATSAASFAFGASTAAASKPADQPFMFGASTAAKPAETEASKPAIAPFTFGGAAAKETPALPAFGSFGAAPATAAAASTGITPSFSFDSKPAAAATSLPAFGLPGTAVAPAATSGSFIFGAGNATTTAGKPPLASNSLGGSTLTFPQAGVAAVDARTTANNGNGNGSTMDTGSFSNNQTAPAAAIGGNPFSSSFSTSNPFGGAGSTNTTGPFGAPSSGGNAFAFPAAPAPSSGLGSALGSTTPSGGFAFGSNNNLANAAPAFGGSAFGAPAASGNPFGAPAASSNPFGGASAAAVNPFSSQPAGAFGAAPASGLQPVGSSSNLFGGAPAGGMQGMSGAPFGSAGAMGGFGGSAFGSTGSLQSLGSTGNVNNMGSMGGMGGFGLQSQPSVDGGAGGFSLGATGKSTADIAGRRKVKVKGRP